MNRALLVLYSMIVFMTYGLQYCLAPDWLLSINKNRFRQFKGRSDDSDPMFRIFQRSDKKIFGREKNSEIFSTCLNHRDETMMSNHEPLLVLSVTRLGYILHFGRL